MSELVFVAVVEGPLLGVNAHFGPGCSVVLGTDSAALSTLVGLVAGRGPPRRGRVLDGGRPIHASPELRRGTATLLAEESLPGLGRVSDAVAAVLAARADRRDARALLDEAGLGAWAARRSRDLDASELRTLALALAVLHPSPRLLALYEPLAAGRALGADFVRSGVARALEAGAVVLVATQSLDDARSFGGTPWLLLHGVLTNAPHLPIGAPPGADQTFVIDTPDARRLTAALARDPAVRGVRWNEEHAPDTVLVFGSDTERVASAIVRVLAEESASVRSLGLSPIALPALLSASTGVLPGFQAYPFAAPPPPSTYPYAAPPASPALGAPGVHHDAPPVAEQATAPAPPNQSVGMPTTFADPTRPPGSGGS